MVSLIQGSSIALSSAARNWQPSSHRCPDTKPAVRLIERLHRITSVDLDSTKCMRTPSLLAGVLNRLIWPCLYFARAADLVGATAASAAERRKPKGAKLSWASLV
jgi:hypothetical protein